MHYYKVVANEQISPSTQLITIENNEQGRPFGFQPGQYAAISFWHNGKPTPARCFSIVSSPTDQEKLQFCVRIQGHYTKAIEAMQVGDPVKVFGPFGGFIFNTLKDKDVLMLAGGIGITPFISMIRYITRLKTNNKVTLLYSCRNENDIPFVEELLQHDYENPNFKVYFAIGDKQIAKLPTKYAIAGRITPEIIDHINGGEYQDKRFFICGPPPFMTSMTVDLLNRGVPRKNIMTESFSQASHPQSGILKSWPANVYAASAISLMLGSIIVTASDLVQSYKTNANAIQAIGAPYLITSARQQQLDQLVNSIPISSSVVISPTSDKSVPTAVTPSVSSLAHTSQNSSLPTSNTTVANPTSTPSTTTSTTPVATAPPVTTTPAPTPPTTGSGGTTKASSDIRLKRDIKILGTTKNGFGLYSFRYLWGLETYVGVMAQEILVRYPDAVSVDKHGYLCVEYAKIGLRMVRLREWVTNNNAVYDLLS